MKQILSSIFIGLLIFTPLSTVHAQSSSLTLIPPVIESQYGPGDFVTETVRLKNSSNQQITLYPYVQDFYLDENDNMIFIGEESDLPEGYSETYERFSLREWISIQDSISIEANSEVRVSFNVQVPEDAFAGGRYAAIFFSYTPVLEGAQTGVGFGSDLGLLVTAVIPGDDNTPRFIGKVRPGRINAEGDFKKKFFFSRWFSFNNGPFSFALTYSNESFAHKRVEAIYIIEDLIFGRPAISLKTETNRIFPSLRREVIGTHEEKRMYGIFKIFVDARDNEGVSHTSHTYFVGIPPILVFVIFILAIYATRKYLEYRDKKVAEKLNTKNSKRTKL